MGQLTNAKKLTPIGFIPEDWDYCQLREHLELLTDYDANGSFADMANNVHTEFGSGYAWYVRATDLEQKTPLSEVRYADKSSYEFLKKSTLYGGEVLVAKRGEIGKVYYFVKPQNLRATLAPNLYLLKLKESIHSQWLYYFFISPRGQELLKSINASTSLGAIYKEDVKNLCIPLPNLNEQKKIAEALSRIDDMIGALDETIAKKRQIKEGLMQQLMTGKTRLPGFSGEWVELELGAILSYEQPGPFLVHSTDYVETGIPVLTAGKTFILGYTNENFGIYDKLPVIIFDDFVTESKFVDFPFKAKSSAMKMLSLRDKTRHNIRFIYDVMQLIDFPMTDHKRWWIAEYSHLKVRVPASIEEENAIANTFSSIDAEIHSLESQRDKYRLIKQGMMQELLTGKTRLI